MKNKNSILLFTISFLLILSDQITKLAVKGFHFFGINHEGLGYYNSIPVWGTKIQFTLVENPGMAFGISFGEAKIFLSLFSIFAAIILANIVNKVSTKHLGIRIGFLLIFSGAVGNLIDRVFYGIIFNNGTLFYGKVVDFIQVDIPDLNFMGINYTHFPVFNIADSCVTCGVVLLLVFSKHIPQFNEIIPFLNKEKMDNLIDPPSENDIIAEKNESTDKTTL